MSKPFKKSQPKECQRRPERKPARLTIEERATLIENLSMLGDSEFSIVCKVVVLFSGAEWQAASVAGRREMLTVWYYALPLNEQSLVSLSFFLDSLE